MIKYGGRKSAMGRAKIEDHVAGRFTIGAQRLECHEVVTARSTRSDRCLTSHCLYLLSERSTEAQGLFVCSSSTSFVPGTFHFASETLLAIELAVPLVSFSLRSSFVPLLLQFRSVDPWYADVGSACTASRRSNHSVIFSPSRT